MSQEIKLAWGESVDIIFPSGAKVTAMAVEDRIGTKSELVCTDNPDILNRAGALWSNIPLQPPKKLGE